MSSVFFEDAKHDELVKNHRLDDTVESSRCKAHKSLVMRRTCAYVGMTKDEALAQ